MCWSFCVILTGLSTTLLDNYIKGGPIPKGTCTESGANPSELKNAQVLKCVNLQYNLLQRNANSCLMVVALMLNTHRDGWRYFWEQTLDSLWSVPQTGP